jgi:NDP-sugar pyrophosphorylase family protein
MFSDTCVILAAGRGTRMNSDVPKPLIPVADKPILGHVIDFWKAQGVTDFIFVVGYRRDLVIEYLESSRLKQYRVVIQPELKGIADAVLQIEDQIEDKFIVALGDCLNLGTFQYPVAMDLGYGIWDNEYKKTQACGCDVIVNNGEVVAIYEKPPMDYAGLGTYFFDKRIFNYIRNAQPSQIRNEIDIADVMTNMIKDGQHIKAIPLHGDFINCTYPRDIRYAEKILNIGVRI